MDIIKFKVNGREHICKRDEIIQYLSGTGEIIYDLDLSKCNIELLPTFPDTRVFNSITNLDLSHNDIQLLGKQFYNLHNLSTINLSHNHLIQILPYDIFFRNINLQKVDLSYNHLSALSPLSFNVNIRTIDLSYNAIINMPKLIKDFGDVTLDCNIIREPPPRPLRLKGFDIEDMSDIRRRSQRDITKQHQNRTRYELSGGDEKLLGIQEKFSNS